MPINGRAAQRLVAHLRRLENLGPEKPEVDQDIEHLEGDLQFWFYEPEEAVANEQDNEEPNEDRLDRLPAHAIPRAAS